MFHRPEPRLADASNLTIDVCPSILQKSFEYEEPYMGRKGISRRDCLALFGASAAAAMTPAFGQAGRTSSKGSAQEATLRDAKVATQSEIEELKELSAQRSFAPTPVQLRPEYAAGPFSGGQEIQLREGWEFVGAKDNDPPGQYASGSS